jgi:hypothetical protein
MASDRNVAAAAAADEGGGARPAAEDVAIIDGDASTKQTNGAAEGSRVDTAGSSGEDQPVVVGGAEHGGIAEHGDVILLTGCGS